MAIGRLFYDACIPTNVVNSLYFKPILDVIAQLVVDIRVQLTIIFVLIF